MPGRRCGSSGRIGGRRRAGPTSRRSWVSMTTMVSRRRPARCGQSIVQCDGGRFRPATCDDPTSFPFGTMSPNTGLFPMATVAELKARREALSAARASGVARVEARRLRPQPRLAEVGDRIGPPRDDADGERVPVRRLPGRVAAEVRIGEERIDRSGEGAHQVRRALRSTCGRVQIGSGLLSISSRTHSSRSRSGIARA